MFRIDQLNTSVAQPTPEAVGTPGYFKKAVPENGERGTQVTADWLNAVQEEIVQAILAKGISLDKTLAPANQLALANIKKKALLVAGANKTIDPADREQIFYASTGASNRTFTLPDIDDVPYTFKKVDTGAGFLIISRSGSDTIEGSNTSITLHLKNESITLVRQSGVWKAIAYTPSDMKSYSPSWSTSGGGGGTFTSVTAYTVWRKTNFNEVEVNLYGVGTTSSTPQAITATLPVTPADLNPNSTAENVYGCGVGDGTSTFRVGLMLLSTSGLALFRLQSGDWSAGATRGVQGNGRYFI